MYTINYLMPLLHLFLFLSQLVSAKVIARFRRATRLFSEGEPVSVDVYVRCSTIIRKTIGRVSSVALARRWRISTTSFSARCVITLDLTLKNGNIFKAHNCEGPFRSVLTLWLDVISDHFKHNFNHNNNFICTSERMRSM